ncbi:unnamed protein product [Durusdinium trenchii]|uniref:Uncharacterized protein n=2 Tax=Durusdinium trenchii TaxID=1381693 RepID=A0ABP0JE39_9DINO
MVAWLALAWLSPVAAISMQETRLRGSVDTNMTLTQSLACERPTGWCSAATYSFEDCNLDGIKDQVCVKNEKKSIRLSGECSTYDISKAEVPDCGMIRKRRHHADDFLYITKSDFKIYKQELSKMTLNSGWIETGKGDIIALVAYQDGLFGIGTNKKIYRQSFAMLSTASKWKLAAKGSMVAGDAVDDTFYGVGTDGRIYSQTISTMSPKSEWTQVVSTPHAQHIASIAIHKDGDMMYAATGNDGKLWKMKLSDVGDVQWTNVPHNGQCFYISIRGDYIYCRGQQKHVWRHKLSELTSSSSWARISATGAESVLVPKVNKCRGELLNRKKDDVACDSIKDDSCGNFYEKVGHTDVYFQCTRSPVSPISDEMSCLAQQHCLLEP